MYSIALDIVIKNLEGSLTLDHNKQRQGEHWTISNEGLLFQTEECKSCLNDGYVCT